MTGCVISDNTSSNFGGGVESAGSYSPTTLIDCLITGNTATRVGGGIHDSEPSRAKYGNQGVFTVTGCTFSGNSASYGGGIAVDGQQPTTGTFILVDSTVSGNKGTFGVGMYNKSASDLINSTFDGSSGGTSGAGTCNEGPLTVTNCTITGNGSTNGGGFHAKPGQGDVILANTLIAGNFTGSSPGTSPSDIVGAVDSTSAYNLIGDADNLTGMPIGQQGNQIDSASGGTQIKPMLGPLANNGGPTATVALLPGSLAIDAGCNALAVDPTTQTPLTTDQRGHDYLRTYGSAVDIGAFENCS